MYQNYWIKQVERIAAVFLLFVWLTTFTAPVAAQDPAARAAQASDIERLQRDVGKIQDDIAFQKETSERFWRSFEKVSWVVAALGFPFLIFQVWSALREERRQRRQERAFATQSQREERLNDQFVNVLSVASQAAEDAQRRVSDLEERGVKRASETLRLINNLLAITERAAAKAAGAQFDFLVKTIENIDGECHKLIDEAKASDDRDIVEKGAYRERVHVLTKQIDSLAIQIITYNESVPKQFASGPVEGDDASAVSTGMAAWTRLELTGPCLFIRGISNHIDQLSTEATKDWTRALGAPGSTAIKEDANYWIGYVLNTQGEFNEASDYLQAAIVAAASEQRKAELARLKLETSFFALDRGLVPEQLLSEGAEYFSRLEPHKISANTLRNFATTMGNMALVKAIRATEPSENNVTPEALEKARSWYEMALSAEKRSRWARFGTIQCDHLSGRAIDDSMRAAAVDVMESARRAYQDRVDNRSKALSRITEYICLLILGDDSRLSDIAASIEYHASMVTARTMYSQFRKQNIARDEWLEEFHHLEASKDVRQTHFFANMSESRSSKRL